MAEGPAKYSSTATIGEVGWRDDVLVRYTTSRNQACRHAGADDDAVQHRHRQGGQQQLAIGLPGTLGEKRKAADGKPFQVPDKEKLHQNATVKVWEPIRHRTQSLPAPRVRPLPWVNGCQGKERADQDRQAENLAQEFEGER